MPKNIAVMTNHEIGDTDVNYYRLGLLATRYTSWIVH